MGVSMDTGSWEPVRLSFTQKSCAAEMLSRAFQDDPFSVFISPDAKRRHRLLRRIFNAQLTYCLIFGRVYTNAQVTGASCWIFSDRANFARWQMIISGMSLMWRRLGTIVRRRYASAVDPMSDMRRNLMKRPYWYLLLLGVDPSCKGQGIGRKLMEPMLTEADHNKLPCFLVTDNEENLGYYKKYGFEAVGCGESPVKFWSMLREPHSKSSIDAGK